MIPKILEARMKNASIMNLTNAICRQNINMKSDHINHFRSVYDVWCEWINNDLEIAANIESRQELDNL